MKTKKELLNHYATREPKEFYQFDGFDEPTGVVDDAPDDDGDELWCRRTYELMCSATVRILIPVGTSKKDAVRILRKLTAWVEMDGLKTAENVLR